MLELFKNMMTRMNAEATEFLIKVDIPVEQEIHKLELK